MARFRGAFLAATMPNTALRIRIPRISHPHGKRFLNVGLVATPAMKPPCQHPYQISIPVRGMPLFHRYMKEEATPNRTKACYLPVNGGQIGTSRFRWVTQSESAMAKRRGASR